MIQQLFLTADCLCDLVGIRAPTVAHRQLTYKKQEFGLVLPQTSVFSVLGAKTLVNKGKNQKHTKR